MNEEDITELDHEHLRAIVKRLPGDFEPWGQVPRNARTRGDCSCSCLWYIPLEGPTGADWGVCTNPGSHRVGLLTFEHQGCLAYEPAPEEGGETEQPEG